MAVHKVKNRNRIPRHQAADVLLNIVLICLGIALGLGGPAWFLYLWSAGA